MYYQDLNELIKRPETTVTLAGLLNPATIAPTLIVGAIGIATFLSIKAYKNLKDENQRLATDKQALKNELKAVIDEYEDEDDELLDNDCETVEPTAEPTVQTMSDEELKKEMIRQAMSELGKRSAAKRAEGKKFHNT